MLPPKAQLSTKAPSTVKAFFTPFRDPCTIGDVAESYQCITDLVSTVEVLAQRGVVHHDIRFANIVYKSTGNNIKYVLVDFDDACLLDESGKCPAQHKQALNASTHCPSSFRQHGPEVDIWSLGYLLQHELSVGENTIAELGLTFQQRYETISYDELRECINNCFEPLLHGKL